MKKNKNIVYQFLDYLKSLFLNGMLLILPISITVFLFSSVFRFIKSWLNPLQRLQPEKLRTIPNAEIFVALSIILLIGFLSKIFFLKRIIHFVEDLISRLPLVRPVYSGIKQLVHALTDHDKMSFSKVVLAEYPNTGSYCLAFMTGECPEEISPHQNRKFFNVYIPTTPNPTTGFFILMPVEKVIETDLTRHEAMTIIISGGIIKPDRFNKKLTGD